jgi:hypothetical protein
MTKLLAGIAAALLAIGVLVVATNSDSDPKIDASGSASSTTVPNNEATTTTTTAASSQAATAKPPPWKAPKPGVYRFHASRSGDGAYERDGEIRVAADGPKGYTESRPQEATTSTRAYTIDGGTLRLTHFTLSSPSGSSTCTWDKPLTIMTTTPEWTSKAACHLPLRAGDADIKVDLAWKVVGIRDAKVGNDTVPLLRVDGTSKTETTTKDGTIVKTSTIVNYFDTARGLLAQSTEDATETGPSGTTTYRIVETMLTVQPEDPK